MMIRVAQAQRKGMVTPSFNTAQTNAQNGAVVLDIIQPTILLFRMGSTLTRASELSDFCVRELQLLLASGVSKPQPSRIRNPLSTLFFNTFTVIGRRHDRAMPARPDWVSTNSEMFEIL